MTSLEVAQQRDGDHVLSGQYARRPTRAGRGTASRDRCRGRRAARAACWEGDARGAVCAVEGRSTSLKPAAAAAAAAAASSSTLLTRGGGCAERTPTRLLRSPAALASAEVARITPKSSPPPPAHGGAAPRCDARRPACAENPTDNRLSACPVHIARPDPTRQDCFIASRRVAGGRAV